MPSESPKWLPLVLSLVAIAVSGLSWWESHRNRVINEEVNRPLLSVTTIAAEASEPKAGRLYMFFTVKLKNNGKGTANVSDVIIEPRLALQPNGCEIVPLGKVDNTRFEVLPGFEQSFEYVTSVTLDCKKDARVYFGLRLLITYTDSGSGREYFQTFIEGVGSSTSPPRPDSTPPPSPSP
jgi:hypothetical protein